MRTSSPRSSRFILVILAMTISAPSTAHPRRGPEVRRDSTENVSLLPVAAEADKRVLYSVGPVTLPAGTVVELSFQAEVTNDLGSNVGVGRAVIRASTAEATEGTDVTRPCMSNVTPDEHPGVLVHAGVEVLPANDDQFDNVVAWAVSDSVRGTLRVEQRYGELIVLSTTR